MAKTEHPKNSPWMTLDLPLFSRIGATHAAKGTNTQWGENQLGRKNWKPNLSQWGETLPAMKSQLSFVL